MKRLYLLVTAVIVTAILKAGTARDSNLSARDLLALLPEGPTKRQFIIDCTGCHTFHSGIAYPNGRKRTEAEWRAAITRMLSFAGPTSNFPVISVHADADSTARWLAASLPDSLPKAEPRKAAAEVTEYMLPAARDLPHDVAVLDDGRVLITGMFTHRMYLLNPADGTFDTVPIPVEHANPRAVEVDAHGKWWVLLGGPHAIATYEPRSQSWRTHAVGMYPHSIAVDAAGSAWFNGHFSVNPELIGRVDAQGGTRTFEVPAHPVKSQQAGGAVPYELRAARDGGLWGSELQGDRIFRFDPRTESFRIWTLGAHAGPRRLDVDARGKVWIPQYGAGNIAVLDPSTDKITEIDLPIANTAPYVVRVDDRRNAVWIATGAGDVVFRYDPRSRRFTSFELPATGALVRHMDIDERTGAVWLAYGASPGMAARIARLKE